MLMGNVGKWPMFAVECELMHVASAVGHEGIVGSRTKISRHSLNGILQS